MSSLLNKFRGTGVAIVTPFDKNGSVDFKSLEKVVNHIVKGKCEYIVVLGTTGESVTLSKDEKKEVVKCVVKAVNKRVPVVIGIGGNDTADIINTIKHTDFKGIDAILSVSPYYNKPNQRGIIAHYKAIAKVAPVPIILYNVPGRTSSNMLAETTLTLAREVKNIIAVKEASGNMEQVMKIIKNKPEGFLVISGDDAITLPIIACGGDGVISVVANAFPKYFSEMVRLATKHYLKDAQKLHYKLLDITEQLFADGNPAGIKATLAELGLCKDHVRLPLVNVNDQVQKKIEELVKKIK